MDRNKQRGCWSRLTQLPRDVAERWARRGSMGFLAWFWHLWEPGCFLLPSSLRQGWGSLRGLGHRLQPPAVAWACGRAAAAADQRCSRRWELGTMSCQRRAPAPGARHHPAPAPCLAEWGKTRPQKPPRGVLAKSKQGTSLLPRGTWSLRVMPPAATAKSSRRRAWPRRCTGAATRLQLH